MADRVPRNPAKSLGYAIRRDLLHRLLEYYVAPVALPD